MFSPVGPPHLLSVRAGDTRVIAVPGRYCLSYVLVGRERLVVVDVETSETSEGTP